MTESDRSVGSRQQRVGRVRGQVLDRTDRTTMFAAAVLTEPQAVVKTARYCLPVSAVATTIAVGSCMPDLIASSSHSRNMA